MPCIVSRTLYAIRFIAYMHDVHCMLYGVNYVILIILCTIYVVHSMVYIVCLPYTPYGIHCMAYII